MKGANIVAGIKGFQSTHGAIVTTTINPPTEALRKFAAMKDWELIVAGDKKTPHHEFDIRCHYLSPDWQLNYDPALSDAIGWNCIQRRNFAFLYAVKELKADIIATIDDDNIPLENWGEICFEEEVRAVHDTKACAFDPMVMTDQEKLWHRGFPLELLHHRHETASFQFERSKVHIQANLWNGDPDIDAICRIVHAPLVSIGTNEMTFTSTKPSPFNSQNTMLLRDVMPHYFMFPGIGRMDDIWAAYHVQAQGFKVAYGPPTVYQKRNPHNVIADMKAEYLGYENNLAIVKEVPTNKNAVLDRLPPRALEAFRLYQAHYE